MLPLSSLAPHDYCEGMDDDPLLAPMAGCESGRFGGITYDVAPAGNARIKRLVFLPGGKWSEFIKPMVDTAFCEHAHVGFLARGRFMGEYADGTSFDYKAPAVIAVDPGHDSWVEGDEPVVLIQIDFERDTVERLGLTPRTAG